MKKLVSLKTLVFTATMALFAMSLSAQRNDAFISNFDDNYVNRDPVIGWSIINNGIGQEEPLGSGLLILTAVGAGYAVMRRRRSHKDASRHVSTLLLAVTLVLGMTGCRKNVETLSQIGANTVHITLNVDDGSKAVVNPTGGENYATVTYEDGDIIYVGYNNQYVGTLTYKVIDEETKYFEGDITIGSQVGDQPLHFYFLGGKGFDVNRVDNIATVNISDQTSRYPVISYGTSFENYDDERSAYSTKLFNKCSIMKFNVKTDSRQPIYITGMNNKVTVNFANPGSGDNGFNYSRVGVGIVMSACGESTSTTAETKWAVVLPQSALAAGDQYSVYTKYTKEYTTGDETEYYYGTREAMDEIVRNQYIDDGFDLNVVNTYDGVLPGAFSITSSNTVHFSKGNLQYQASTNTWHFAQNQWNWVGITGYLGNVSGSNNKNASSTYSGWVDIFAWGTSGYNHGATNYQPWVGASNSINNTDHNVYGSMTKNLYDKKEDETMEGKADWGYNAISNGGNSENLWRTLTNNEQQYVFGSRGAYSFAKAIVNGVNGVILFPNGWDNSLYSITSYNVKTVEYNTNTITLEEWNNIFEVNGAVFLPAAGHHFNNSGTSTAGTEGFYSSSNYYSENNIFGISFSSTNMGTQGAQFARRFRSSVRLIRK